MNYQELTEQFIGDHDWAKETVKWYRRQLVLFDSYLAENQLKFEEITAGDFTRMLKAMRDEGRSYSSRNGIYTAVQNFCGWCKLNGYLERHPFSDPDMKPNRPAKERKVVKTINPAHMQAILRASSIDDDVVSRRDSAIVYLLATTGMRRSEVIHIELADINLEGREILLKKTKFHHERYVFLTDEAIVSLERWLAWRPKCHTDSVFITMQTSTNGIHQPLNPNGINRILSRVISKANLPKEVRITPHMFRHTYATQIAKIGDPVALMMLMGHTNLQSTERYIHPDKDHLRAVALRGPKGW